MSKPSIIYIGNISQDEFWFNSLSTSLEKYAALKTIEPEDDLGIQSLESLADMVVLVIIDSGGERDFLSVISQVRSSLPASKILVFSASPTWTESRQAMYAGANRYCRKHLDRHELLEEVELLIGPPPAE